MKGKIEGRIVEVEPTKLPGYWYRYKDESGATLYAKSSEVDFDFSVPCRDSEEELAEVGPYNTLSDNSY